MFDENELLQSWDELESVINQLMELDEAQLNNIGGWIRWKRVGNFFKKVGSGIKKVAKKTWHVVKKVAKKTWHVVKKVGRAVGRYCKRNTGRCVKIGRNVVKSAVSMAG